MKKESIKKPELIYNEEYDIHITPYLTCEEVAEVGELILSMPNPMEQEIALAYGVLRFCTDIEDEELEGMAIDDVMWSGLWQDVADEIYNLDAVMSYVKYYEDAGIALANFLNKTAPKFLETLDKSLNKYIKKLPKGAEWDEFMQNTPKMLEDVLEQVKQDGNADIIAGAMKMGE